MPFLTSLLRLPPHNTRPLRRAATALCLLLTFALSGICDAQPTPATAPVQTDFAIVLLADAPLEVSYLSNGVPVKMTLQPYERSSLQRYRGPQQLVLYRGLPAATSAQQSAQQSATPQNTAPAGTVSLPDDAHNTLILVSPAADGTLHAVALNNDESTFPRGNARVLNATSQPLAISAGEQPVLLQPGGQQLLRGNGLNLQLKVAGRINDAWQLLDTSLFGLKNHARRTIVLLESDSRHFQLHAGEEAPPQSTPLQIFSFLN